MRSATCAAFSDVALEPAPGLNLLTGDNGAGKTSVLEALHLMAYGRSFRGRGSRRPDPQRRARRWRSLSSGRRTAAARAAPGCVTAGSRGKAGWMATGCRILASCAQPWRWSPSSRAATRWSLAAASRGDGLPIGACSTWNRIFCRLWRRYARALKQRNALLKTGAGVRQLEAWDRELAEAGEAVTLRREQYLARLQDQVAAAAAHLAPELGAARLEFQPGWRRDELSLADALLLARDRDRSLGYTSVGPHRADWRLDFAALPNRELLSRGQGKLTALSCLLAQAEDCADQRGEWPVIALDDLASELDPAHQAAAADRAAADRGAAVRDRNRAARR